MTITQTLTEFTEPTPSRADQSFSEFSGSTDTFLSEIDPYATEIDTWSPEVNAIAGNINTNSSQVFSNTSSATSTANFLGSWSSQTGAASVPTSVSHNDTLWILLDDISDITLSEPGVSTDWQEVIIDYRTWGTNSTNTTLTSVSFTSQSMTTASTTITLPDATTLENGSSWFISNASDGLITIKYDDNSTFIPMRTQESYFVILQDNSTSNGTWVWHRYDAKEPSIILADSSVFSSNSTSYIHTTMIDSTKILVCYHYSGNAISQVLEVIDGVISPGDPETLTTDTVDVVEVVKLSETKALVCYEKTSSSQTYGRVLDISGTDIVLGTETVVNSTDLSSLSLGGLSSSQAILCFSDTSGSSYGKARILDISGSTITPGTTATFESAITTNINVTILSSTRAIVCYRDGGTNAGTACLLDVSASTITPRTPSTFDSNTTIPSVTALSSTEALVCYNSATSKGEACVLTISGNTITANTSTIFNDGGTSVIDVVNLSSAQAVVCYQDNTNSNYGTACVLDIDSAVVTTGDIDIFNNFTTDYISITALSSVLTTACYQDQGNSSYGTAQQLFIVN